MRESKLSGVGIKGPVYWMKVAEEMEACKLWWEKAKDKSRM